MQELIVTEHYSLYERDMKNFECLVLPKLSMLFVRERFVGPESVLQFPDSDSSDSSDSSDGSDEVELSWITDSEASDNMHSDTDLNGSMDSKSNSEKSGSRNRETKLSFKGLDLSCITVLDRLHDGGIQLTRLGISLDFESQWVRLSINFPSRYG